MWDPDPAALLTVTPDLDAARHLVDLLHDDGVEAWVESNGPMDESLEPPGNLLGASVYVPSSQLDTARGFMMESRARA